MRPSIGKGSGGKGVRLEEALRRHLVARPMLRRNANTRRQFVADRRAPEDGQARADAIAEASRGLPFRDQQAPSAYAPASPNRSKIHIALHGLVPQPPHSGPSPRKADLPSGQCLPAPAQRLRRHRQAALRLCVLLGRMPTAGARSGISGRCRPAFEERASRDQGHHRQDPRDLLRATRHDDRPLPHSPAL